MQEDADNPFLADFYADRPGAALQAQLFYLLSRHRQQSSLRQSDLFSQITVCDYLFDRDKIYAYPEPRRQRAVHLSAALRSARARRARRPIWSIYLQAPTDVLLRRLRIAPADAEEEVLIPDAAYLQELNEAYHHFFFHYAASPLLVVETSGFGARPTDEVVDDLLRQVEAMGRGTRYYVPRIPTKHGRLDCISRAHLDLGHGPL